MGHVNVFKFFLLFSMIAQTIYMIEALSSTAALRGSFRGSTFRVLTHSGKRKGLQYKKRSYSQCNLLMMPEGPEVRTVVDQLQGGVGMRYEGIEFLSGRYTRTTPTGFEDFCSTITPTNVDAGDFEKIDLIQEWGAKGKFIYIILDDGKEKPPEEDDDFKRSIWITLGMSGRFISESLNDQKSTTPRWSIKFRKSSKKISQVFYHDPRNFGTLKFCLSAKALQDKIDSLGPDILDPSTTEDVFVGIVAKQKAEMNVCKFLMNQKKICGIGNYILAEGLYRSLTDPFCSLKEISEEQLRSLFRHLQETAAHSYQSQGVTFDGGSYRNVEGNKGNFQFQLQCYGRKTCPRGKNVIRDSDGPHGRTIWYTEDQLFLPLIMRFGALGDEGENENTTTEELSSSSDTFTPPRATGSRQLDEVIDSKSPPDTSGLVDKLTSGLKDEGWRDVLSTAINSEKFHELASFLDNERKHAGAIYPPEKNIFAALNLCPLEKVRVVIVGQDPYHGPGQGHGLSFSVQPGIRVPPSLKNIFKEAQADVGINVPLNGDLSNWASQGVLLLNSVLTVQQGKANSHAKKGWEEFTDAIIDVLNDQKDDIVFLLWGGPAHRKASNVDETRHTIIRTSHPSPLGATKTKAPFLGSRCFSRTNEALNGAGKDPIDWNIS